MWYCLQANGEVERYYSDLKTVWAEACDLDINFNVSYLNHAVREIFSQASYRSYIFKWPYCTNLVSLVILQLITGDSTTNNWRFYN